MFNVKELKISKFIKSIWQLITSTSNATLEVPLPRPCYCWYIYVLVAESLFLLKSKKDKNTKNNVPFNFFSVSFQDVL